MNPLHPADKKLFDEYPAPLWEANQKLHATHINSTTPYFAPMLHWITRAIGACYAVEIGIAQGYTSWYMASAIKDNNLRYQMNGKYVAIDIADKSHIFNPLIEQGYPIEFIQSESVKWLETQTLLQPNQLDIVFIDGWHQDDYVRREMELLYPLLKDNGNGYAILHDIYGYCEKIYDEILKNPNYEWESVRFINNYGLAIMRKMSGYDYKKVHWPEGCQKKEDGFVQ